MSEEKADTQLSAFEVFSTPMLGLEVTHLWRGHGSALFLEMGKLTPRIRRDGTPGNPHGEMGLMIEWSWRIEDAHKILAGSWSDEELWQYLFDRITGSKVIGVSLFARLPEVQLMFSNGLHLCSMMTSDGDPKWAVFDRRDGTIKSVGVRDGILHFEGESAVEGGFEI
jgi:hypothetical protein